MPDPKNPLSRLNRQELVWLAGILKDACRERLERNLVSQEFEARLYRRGPVDGRLDPRPFLKLWEPRYRKFLDVAKELHAMAQGEHARTALEALRGRLDAGESVERLGPAQATPERVETRGRRKSRSG